MFFLFLKVAFSHRADSDFRFSVPHTQHNAKLTPFPACAALPSLTRSLAVTNDDEYQQQRQWQCGAHPSSTSITNSNHNHNHIHNHNRKRRIHSSTSLSPSIHIHIHINIHINSSRIALLADPSPSTPSHTPLLLLQENKTLLATRAGLLPTLLPVLRFIAHSNSLFAILEGAARFAAIVSQVQTRYCPPSSVLIHHR